jgi:hypothetical protein
MTQIKKQGDKLIYGDNQSKVYLTQEIPGTSIGQPKYNILGAQKFGQIVTVLPERSQIIMSPGPLIQKLKTLLKDYTTNDYLLLSGDPAIIGVVCSVVSDITNGKYNLLKWDRQEKTYYPIEVDIFQK